MPIDGRPDSHADVDDTLLEFEASFYYLGDMLNAGDGCESAFITRCCVAWGQIQKVATCTHYKTHLPENQR